MVSKGHLDYPHAQRDSPAKRAPKAASGTSQDQPNLQSRRPNVKKRRELVNATIHSYARAGIAEDAVTLRQGRPINDSNNNVPSMSRPLDLPAAPDPAHGASHVASTEGKGLPRRKGGSAFDIDESSSHTA